ncbi:MAG: winged helix-turn-helix transcriptional regulator [Sphaerochaetaceae bacterium]
MYTQLYAETTAQCIEGDTFRTIIPLAKGATVKASPYTHETSTHSSLVLGKGLSYTPSVTRNENVETRILFELSKESSLTQQELSVLVGLSLSTVKRVMKSMIEDGSISQVGGRKRGYWKLHIYRWF